jgi:hypothetical protein
MSDVRKEDARQRNLVRFYGIMDKLERNIGGARRMGTHALRAGGSTTLWGRLSAHRGQLRTGCGNHRSSIFRLNRRHGGHQPRWSKIPGMGRREFGWQRHQSG